MRTFDALRYAALAFAVGLAAHGVDHAIRGFDVVSSEIAVAGNIQVVAAMITVALVFLGHRFAPIAAVVIGAGSALGFTAAHLLPTWSAFSDSFVTPAPGAGVTAYSWLTALLEIGTALVFAVVGAAGAPRDSSAGGVITPPAAAAPSRSRRCLRRVR